MIFFNIFVCYNLQFAVDKFSTYVILSAVVIMHKAMQCHMCCAVDS